MRNYKTNKYKGTHPLPPKIFLFDVKSAKSLLLIFFLKFTCLLPIECEIVKYLYFFIKGNCLKKVSEFREKQRLPICNTVKRESRREFKIYIQQNKVTM